MMLEPLSLSRVAEEEEAVEPVVAMVPTTVAVVVEVVPVGEFYRLLPGRLSILGLSRLLGATAATVPMALLGTLLAVVGAVVVVVASWS